MMAAVMERCAGIDVEKSFLVACVSDSVEPMALCAISARASTGSERYCGIRRMPSGPSWSEPGRHSRSSC